MNTALLLVDIQNDFLPTGALPVPEGDQVVPVANRLMPHFKLVVATRDWHPPDHCSFADNHPGFAVGDTVTVAGIEQMLWPTHCVCDTPGAAFAPALNQEPIARIISKGTDPQTDSYSGFFDNARRHDTGLHDFLRNHEIKRLCVVGLATNVCVVATVLDARDLGYEVSVPLDGCRGVELTPGATAESEQRMRAAGAQLTTSSDALATT